VFAEEGRDFQVALATPSGGVLRVAANASRGGYLDLLQFYQEWEPETVIATLDGVECREPQNMRLLFLAGRRATELAEDRSGLLTGWHDRVRAWWGDRTEDMSTLLSIGICDQLGVIRGERFAFLELFGAVAGPAQVVFFPDEALVPCSAVLLQQLNRGPAEHAAIAQDLAQSLLAGSVVPTPADWIFAGALLAALGRSPFTETHDVLTPSGLTRSHAPDVAILSLGAESATILRHKRLGYAINLHQFRIESAGKAIYNWLRGAFEPVARQPDDIRKDYCALVDALSARGGARLLIVNSMSTSGYEDLHNYSAFDHPMSKTLSSIRAKEMNLMLHDLCRERDVAIVDLDAIAAELGAAAHLPDGIHPSGPLQAELRAEILRILRASGVRGFGAQMTSNATSH
jgi:hypothetical protein